MASVVATVFTYLTGQALMAFNVGLVNTVAMIKSGVRIFRLETDFRLSNFQDHS